MDFGAADDSGTDVAIELEVDAGGDPTGEVTAASGHVPRIIACRTSSLEAPGSMVNPKTLAFVTRSE